MTVKETVLRELKNADDFISGEELAERCHVTRASVWKAVKKIQDEGAEILAVNNRGYKLVNEDFYSKSEIEKFLRQKNASDFPRVDFYEQIDSTNTQAKRLLLEKNCHELHKTVVVAASQTAGKGRLGRHFYSPAKTGIYFSIIFAPQNGFDTATLTAHAAVGICRAIKNTFGIETKIKWVNDIFLNDSKVCGILTEGTANLETGKIDAAIIGIGINIKTSSEIPEEILKTAGSILSDGKSYNRSAFLAECITEVLKILEGDEKSKKDSIKEYRGRSNLIGKEITVTPVINVEKGKYKCRVKDISDDAKLVVQTQDGKILYLDSGEVSLHQESCQN